MIAPLKPGVTLTRLDDPVVETEHLLLRPWRAGDIAANTAMADWAETRYCLNLGNN